MYYDISTSKLYTMNLLGKFFLIIILLYKTYIICFKNKKLHLGYILNNKELKDTIELCESLVLENGKIIVRPSNIENEIRIYVETTDKNLTQEIFEKINHKIQQLL